jgi:hypothetical protein
MRDTLDTLHEIEQEYVLEVRPVERRQLRRRAEQMRESYNNYRQEYDDLLRKEIPTWFAPSEQSLIHTVVQQLNADQVTLTHIVLREADRNPDAPEFTHLAAEVAAAVAAVQQELAAKNTPAANHIAQVAQVIQAPTADVKQKLKLSIPLIPLVLSYETEFNLNIAANLKATWERLTQRFRHSYERKGEALNP